MGSKNAHGCTQNAKNCLTLTLLEWYNKEGNEFLSDIVRVTGDETWLPFGNVETKEQSKQWMHSHSQNKLKKFKQMLLVRISAVSWDRKGVLMVEFMLQGTKMSEVYCETLKHYVRPFRTKGMLYSSMTMCVSAYSFLYLSTAGAFQLGVVWPPSLQPWSHSKLIPPVYLPEELVGITALQQ
jgi:hypothetical protein